jgi:hypothetical protein
LRLYSYFNEKIQPPLFTTTTCRVFIVHELHYMLAFYIHDTPEDGLYKAETCSVTRVQ